MVKATASYGRIQERRTIEGIERLTTPRMIAERLTEADYADVRRMHLYPQIMKTLSVDGQPLPDQVTKEGLLQNKAHWQRHGFGLWTFRDRRTREFLGRAGLQSYTIEGEEAVGLVYSVICDHWNRGLATEMAAASLDIGFRHLRLSEVASWTLPSNLPSRRVMEKLGFRYNTDIVFAGLPNSLYRLTVIDWDLGRGC